MRFFLTLLLSIFIVQSAFADTAKTNIIDQPPSFGEVIRRAVHGNFLAGRSATILRDTSAASVYWRAAYRQEPRNAVLLERAFISTLADGSIEEAFPLAERIITVDKSHRLARIVLAIKTARVFQFNAAKIHINSIGKAHSDLTTILISAWIASGQEDEVEAIKILDRLGQNPAYKAFQEYHAGLILSIAEKKIPAGDKLKTAYLADPGVMRMMDAYVRWLSQNNKKDEALAVITNFEKLVPNHPTVMSLKKSLNEGFTLTSTVTNSAQGISEVLYGLGVALARNQGEDIAVIYLQMALYLDPNHDLASLAVADIFETSKNFPKSIALYRTMKPTSPLKGIANIQIAYNLEGQDKSDDARFHLEGLLREKPNDLEIIQALGNLHRTKKNYKEAADTYSRAISLIEKPDARNWSLFYFRGMAYERAKDWTKAELDLQKALELVPENSLAGKAQVLNYLGYSWVDQGKNIDQGLEMIKEALRLTPGDGYITDSLGWAYYRLNRMEEAMTELERAVELKPDDPTLNDHLGDAYWYGGRRLEARFKWQHAIDMKPEAEDLPKIEDKLKNGLPEVKAEAK